MHLYSNLSDLFSGKNGGFKFMVVSFFFFCIEKSLKLFYTALIRFDFFCESVSNFKL